MIMHHKTILVAEDSPVQAEMLRRGLENVGYRVLEARDGEQALALAALARPLVVLSDIRMPKMDGYQLCRAIRAHELLADIPVILLTELSDPLDVIQGLDSGADAYVTKPYDYPTLVERIESLAAVRVPSQTNAHHHANVRISGTNHEVSAQPARILNLLVSTYENAVLQNRQLAAAQEALEFTNASLEQRVLDKTARLRKRVLELKLLQDASRLLSERQIDNATLTDLVRLIPPAWQHPNECLARISFRGMSAETSGWKRTAHRQAVEFTIAHTSGSIEICYPDGPEAAGAQQFLPEEGEVLDALAHMLVTHAERDLAEERRVALENQLRQSQKMEALGTLAGGIAHDFNNLLTAIGGNTELALSCNPEQDVRLSLEEIRNAFIRARDLVRRILVFSRRQETDRKPMLLTPIVEEALTLLQSSIPANVQMDVHCLQDLPMVLGDASQIHQVIMNLGTNAMHAMEQRGGRLTIAVERAENTAYEAPLRELAPGRYLKVTVGDTGTGISPEIINQIFDPFFSTKGQGGTGLGLAMVHGIVRDHLGAITVESELGRGTTFRVFLPESLKQSATVSAVVEGPARGAGQHIMYVDDEEPLVLMTTRVLESLGYRCTGFSDPHAALQAFLTNSDSFDAVITDMTMPRMSGVDLARSMYRIHPEIPVAIASGYGGEMATLEPTGIRMRITKPATIQDLSAALKELLSAAVPAGVA
jgi:signal transduction histidine kinase